MPKVMNFNMITLKDVEKIVDKYPELVLKKESDILYIGEYKDRSDRYEIFSYHKDDGYIFLNTSIQFRMSTIDGEFEVDDNFYGLSYRYIKKFEIQLKKTMLLYSYLILFNKKLYMYDKQLKLQSDFI